MRGSISRCRAFYRCRLALGDYAAPPQGPPKSLAIREDRIAPVLDEWLADTPTLFDGQLDPAEAV